MKGGIPEYHPFDLPLFELATFQVTLHYTLIEFLSEFIEEMGAVVILPKLHIYVVASLYFLLSFT